MVDWAGRAAGLLYHIIRQKDTGNTAECQSLSLWEQRRRPPPAAETGRSCWGRGQQDASGSEADAGSRNPGSVTEGDGEGKPGTKEHLHSDKHWLLIESSYRCVFVLSQRPCPPILWEGGEHHESIFISYPVRRSKHNLTLCLQVA